MFKYYFKKCQYQELGSVVNGKASRGRYLLISADPQVQEMFPFLTASQKNDSAIIPIIPLDSGDKIYCNYVYHNDKYNGSTAENPRDEKRLYLNKTLERNNLLFKKGDILIFKKEIVLDETGSIDENESLLFMMHLNDRKSSLYLSCDKYIKNSKLKGGHAVYNGELNDFEKLVNIIKEKHCFNTVKIDESVSDRIVKSENIHALFNAASFRDFVLNGYGERCAITGSVIKYDNFCNLEAAHIKPKSHGGNYVPSNGIAMCRDIHWAFDKGFFTIDDDFKIRVHDEINSEFLRQYDGKDIWLPENSFFKPDLEFLKYHRDNIFGLFKKRGRL